MLEPLFDRDSAFVGWIDPERNLFDTEMRWIAFVADGHAWSPESTNWLGAVQGLACFDREGHVVAWSPRRMLARLTAGVRPAQPLRPGRPLRPLQPVRPLRPVRPLTPLSGWSPVPFLDWLIQEPSPVP